MKHNDTHNTELNTEEKILAELAKAAATGKLLLFVGTGFSKAVVPTVDSTGKPTVLSWTELLREVCQRMKLDPNRYILPDSAKYSLTANAARLINVPDIQYACPAIASKLCEEWIKQNPGEEIASAVHCMKSIIASLATWVPLEEMRNHVQSLLLAIRPVGIITTNYDTVLEAALGIKGKSVEKDDLFIPGARIPIWHIHGSIQVPDSIVVTQDDYQLFFRPENYVQRKLTMLLREYTTLFIGYSLGDTNIKTAIDWAMNVYKTPDVSIPMQVRLIHAPQGGKVERDPGNQTMYSINTADCIHFLDKLKQSIDDEKNNRDKIKKRLSLALTSIKNMNDPSLQMKAPISRQISAIRSVMKHQAKDAMFLILPQVQSMLADAKKHAGESGNFAAYANWLRILLILLEEIPQDETPPTMISMLAEELENVLPMAGSHLGQSYDADRLWKSEWPKIPKEKREYYLKLAQQLSLPNLEAKLRKTIDNPK